MNSPLIHAGGKLIAAIVIALGSSYAMAAKYYKWVDENGVTHYSAQPPAKGKGEVIKVRSGVSSDKDAAMKRLSEQRQKLQQDIEKRNNPQTDLEAEADRLNKEAMMKTCASYRKNLEIMTQNARVRMVDEGGEQRVLPEEERQAKIKKAQDFIQKNCN